MIEFDCAHCGWKTQRFGQVAPPSHGLCGQCWWLVTLPREGRDAAALRLFDDATFEVWRANITR